MYRLPIVLTVFSSGLFSVQLVVRTLRTHSESKEANGRPVTGKPLGIELVLIQQIIQTKAPPHFKTFRKRRNKAGIQNGTGVSRDKTKGQRRCEMMRKGEEQVRPGLIQLPTEQHLPPTDEARWRTSSRVITSACNIPVNSVRVLLVVWWRNTAAGNARVARCCRLPELALVP